MIFIDRSIPKPVADALRLVRDDVEWLEPRFPHNATDIQWMLEAGRHGWLCITRDKKIRTRPGERNILHMNRVGCFYIAQKQPLTRWDYLKLLALTLDEMEDIHSRTARPYLYSVGRTGTLRRVV